MDVTIQLVGLVVAFSWLNPTAADFVDGGAAFMGDGVMEKVIHNRDLQELEPEDCVALMRAGDVGRIVWLQRGAEVVGPLVVCDCAQKEHFQARIDQGDVAEVSWQQAVRWDMPGGTGRTAVRVWFRVPPQLSRKRFQEE